LLKPSEYRYMRGGGWANRHITFMVIKKALIYSLFCSIYGIYEGRVLVENVI